MHLKRLAPCLACLAMVAGLAASARADIAYGYAEQTISKLSLTPASGTLTFTDGVPTATTASYTLNGSGTSSFDKIDAKQQGAGPLPPENTFTRTVTGSSPSGASNLTRGDVLISGLGTTNAMNLGVSESFLKSSGSETGNSELTASFAFTPTATGALTVGYTYANDIFVATSGSGAATASYNFDFVVKNNATGLVVFDYASTGASGNTNLVLSAPPPGAEIIRAGTDSITTSSLDAGTSYSLIFTDKTASSATVSVPEPGPMALAGAAGALSFLAGVVRRYRRAR